MIDRIKELLHSLRRNKSIVYNSTLSDILNGGGSGFFVRDIYNDKIYTPHEEMIASRKAYNSNSFITASINTLKDFILGSEQKVEADDKRTENYLNKYIRNIGLLENCLSWLRTT